MNLPPLLWTILAVDAALAGLILRMGQRIDGLSRDVADLRERMARLEGLIEGWLTPTASAPRRVPE